MLPIDSYITRGRINIPYSKLFRSKAELSYPPFAHLQRANLEGKSKFYGAVIEVEDKGKDVDDARVCVLCEISAFARNINSVGIEVVTFSFWRCNRDLHLLSIPIFDSYDKPSDLIRRINNQWDFLTRHSLISNEHICRLKTLSKLFADDFSGHEDNDTYVKNCYNQTASFSEYLMQDDKVDGLIYPSARLKGHGLNIVVKQKVVDETLILHQVVVSYICKGEDKPLVMNIFNCKNPATGIKYLHCSEDVKLLKKWKKGHGRMADYVNK